MTPFLTASTPRSAQHVVTVPKVRLYVEQPERQNWYVHVGHVRDRGRWRTEPHAHPAYGQMIFVSQGRCTMNLEGMEIAFEGPCVLLLPPNCIHSLDYEIDVERFVVTIQLQYLTQINARLNAFIALWQKPRMISPADNDETGSQFYNCIAALKRETESDAIGHRIGAEARLTNLQLMLVRQISPDTGAKENSTGSDLRKVERFRQLIDLHFRENLPLESYVSKMNISQAQLRNACASVANLSPGKMIHARIITEAKRDLIFGDMSMSQVAFGLGFADAAYFTLFFRRKTGQTPSEFRVHARREIAAVSLL